MCDPRLMNKLQTEGKKICERANYKESLMSIGPSSLGTSLAVPKQQNLKKAETMRKSKPTEKKGAKNPLLWAESKQSSGVNNLKKTKSTPASGQIRETDPEEEYD